MNDTPAQGSRPALERFITGFHVGKRTLFVPMNSLNLASVTAVAEMLMMMSLPRISGFEIYRAGDREAGKPPAVFADPINLISAIGPQINDLAQKELGENFGSKFVAPVIHRPSEAKALRDIFSKKGPS